jgi:hypothetical protein
VEAAAVDDHGGANAEVLKLHEARPPRAASRGPFLRHAHALQEGALFDGVRVGYR